MGKDLKGKELGVGLSQRKDKRYQARFTNSNKTRIEKNFTKISDARAWLNEQKYLDSLIKDGGNMTVDEWYNFWIENFKQGFVKENTLKNYALRYKYNIKKEIGYMKLCDVRQINCQKVLNKMFESKMYSNGTIEQTSITLHALFKSAVENEYILRNPASGLKIKKIKDMDEDSERRVLTRAEQKIFSEYSKNTLYYNAFMLVLETGMRAGEIGGLKWEDVDFDDKFLNVKRTLLQAKKMGGFYFGDPKTKTSKRKIPLTNKAVQILKDQQELQQKLKFNSSCWHEEWDGLVFTTINGNPVGASTFRNMMIRIVNNINKDREYKNKNYEKFEHCYMHSLRHTFATRCIEFGMQPKTLQKILGHSSIQITMDLYVHVVDDQLMNEIEKINIAI